MKVTSIVSQCGGTGKTTLAIALAAELAKMGRKTCLVDLDFGGSQMASLFPGSTTYYSNQLLSLARGVSEKVEKLELGTLYEAQGLHLLMADPNSTERIAMLAQQGIGNVTSLSGALSTLLRRLERMGIEHVILDAPPGCAWWTEAAMRVVGWQGNRGNLVCCTRKEVAEVDPFLFLVRGGQAENDDSAPVLVLISQAATSTPAPVRRTLTVRRRGETDREFSATAEVAKMPLLQAPGAASQAGNQDELDIVVQWVAR